MKRFFTFILILLLLATGVLAINNETDFFQNIGTYIPSLGEKYPETVQKISDLSNDVAAVFHQIPSLREIKEKITGEELPLDPSDVAENAYIKDSPMLNFCPTENISIQITDNQLEVFGVVSSYSHANLVICLDSEDGETVSQTAVSANTSNKFHEIIDIPDDYSRYSVDVYTGDKPYGSFVSWVYNYVAVVNNNGMWEIENSPVYESNRVLYEADKSISAALESTLSVQSEYANMISLAEQLTDGCENDYDCALAIHDWVASYLYYDKDSLVSEETAPYSATEVVNRRRAVCLGYATLYATLCRSINIPCNIVSGYALGIANGASEWNESSIASEEQNHAWNEVYVDGRWIIVDTTWDSTNKYENGEFVNGEDISHLYFDANLQFLSANHKIIDYSWRR